MADAILQQRESKIPCTWEHYRASKPDFEGMFVEPVDSEGETEEDVVHNRQDTSDCQPV